MKADLPEPATVEEVKAKILCGYTLALEKEGVCERFLAKKLKAELRAKKSERIKVRGAVNEGDLPRGRRLVARSGTLAYDKEGDQVYGDGDSVIEWDEVAWDIRQKARMDAQKLLNLYPPERIKLDADLTLVHSIPEPKPLPEDDEKKPE